MNYENNFNEYKKNLEQNERNIETNEKLSEENKERLILLLKKTEDIIDDILLNKIDSQITNELSLYLKTLDTSLNKLINNEKIDLDNLENSLNNFLNKYKNTADNYSGFIDETKGYLLGIKKGVIDTKNYIKEDIENLIEFFSDIENIKKLPQLLEFVWNNFENITSNLSEKAKLEFNNIKNEFIALNQLNNKDEISDKIFNYKTISLSIFITGAIIYEFLPIGKISKIKKIDDLEKVILEEIKTGKNKKIKFLEKNKETIHNHLSEKFPLLSILRITPDSKLINFTFGGIKNLNDKFGQENVDILINLVKDNLSNQVNHLRTIRNNYKNLTLNIDKDYNFHLNKIDFEKIILENKDKFKLEKHQKIEDFISLTQKEFNIGVGVSEIKGIDKKAKLDGFYQAEIASRNSKGFEINEYSGEKIKELAIKSLEIEQEIINKFSGEYFIFNGDKVKIIIESISGEKNINPILLRYVRKGKKIKDINGKSFDEINNLIGEYLKSLNNGFDFIAPYHNLKQDMKITENINNQIREGVLDTKYLVKNYKGVLTKESLLKYMEGKKGTAYFIDIKDMGIMNLQEFRQLAKDLADGKQVDLTSAGSKTTKKFIAFTKQLKKENPDLKIALGGDEIYIYSEKSIDITDDIGKKLTNNKLYGRITKYDGKITNGTIDMLDKNANFIKEFEGKIENIDKSGKIKHIILSEHDKAIDLEKIEIDITKEKVKNIISGKKEILGSIQEQQIYGEYKNGNLILNIN